MVKEIASEFMIKEKCYWQYRMTDSSELQRRSRLTVRRT